MDETTADVGDWRTPNLVVDELPLVEAHLTPARRLDMAFELFEVGGRIRAQRHLREHPGSSTEERGEVIREWRADRPGAPAGDVAGTVRVRPT